MRTAIADVLRNRIRIAEAFLEMPPDRSAIDRSGSATFMPAPVDSAVKFASLIGGRERKYPINAFGYS